MNLADQFAGMLVGRNENYLDIRMKQQDTEQFRAAITGTAEDSHSNIALHNRCRPCSLYFPATDSIRFPYESSASIVQTPKSLTRSLNKCEPPPWPSLHSRLPLSVLSLVGSAPFFTSASLVS